MNTNFKPSPYGTKSKNVNDSLSVSLPPTTREVEMSVTGMPSSSKSIPAQDSFSAFANPATGEFGVSATGTPAKIFAGVGSVCLVGGVVYWLYNQTKK